MFAHILHEAQKINPSHWVNNLKYLPFGYGVDLFFIISGYIMMHVAFEKFGTPRAPMFFIAKRLVRVVPAYWLFTLIAASLLYTIPDAFDTASYDLNHLLLSLLFIPHFDPSNASSIQPLLALGWTLNYEMFFYLLFGLSMAFARPVGICAMVMAFILLHIAALMGEIEGAIGIFFGNSIILEFLLGIAAYYIARSHVFARHSYAILIAASMSWLVLVLQSWYVSEMRVVIFGVPSLILFLFLSRFSFRRNGASLLLLEIGDSSYALYLSHPFVLSATFIIMTNLFPQDNPALYVAYTVAYILASITLCVIFSILFFRLAERPLNSFLQRKVRSRERISS